MVNELKRRNSEDAEDLLEQLKKTAIENENLFEGLMEACKYCSLGQITEALFEVGGQYRRNM
jgi:methylmalonyl-CoA mutase